MAVAVVGLPLAYDDDADDGCVIAMLFQYPVCL